MTAALFAVRFTPIKEIFMLNLSIMAMKEKHVEEECADIIEQQRTGATTHAPAPGGKC